MTGRTDLDDNPLFAVWAHPVVSAPNRLLKNCFKGCSQTVFRGRLPLIKVARAVYRTFYEVENSLRYRSRENFNSLLTKTFSRHCRFASQLNQLIHKRALAGSIEP